MKITWPIYIFVLLLLVAATSCNNGANTKQQTSDKADIYTCSMHPQVLEHKPGNCPICGMQLIKKNATAVAITDIPLETLLKPADGFVVASLPVTTPQLKNVNIPVKAYGVIEYDTRNANTISARVSGRIEKLYIRYRYQEVSAGQKIMDIYSPEIVTAEQNLLFLLKNDAGNISFIQAAKEKLLLLGMDEGQLEEVINGGKPLYSISVYSNYNGHVHDAGMMHSYVQPVDMNASPVTQELSLKEGMYVQRGQTLLMLMNHHSTWVALQVFPADQSLIKEGSAVNIIPETDTAAVIKGNIDFIEPFFRSGAKTLTARVYFDNMAMLPVGSHVAADIFASNQQALWLPQTAVLSLGMGSVAFIKSGDGFMAHKITTGIRAGNDIQVLAGLGEKDTVAINGQYFIDSESFIKPSN